MRHDPLVSVIIPVFNGEATLGLCLAAVFQSVYRPIEVIVVDDGSTDSSLAIARGFPCRVEVMATNSGAAASRNQGAHLAQGELLFFLDADIVIETHTLTAIVDTFRQRPAISALFCSYQPHTVPTNFWSQYKNLMHHYTHQTSAPEAATFCGGFGAIKRGVFAEFGGFDEAYRSLEDIELGYRLHQAGHAILLNRAIQVTHLKAYSLLGLIKSDVLHRAIPWTRIMLDKRVFRNDLNTKSNNVLSVMAAYLLLLCLLLLPAIPSAVRPALTLLALFLGLNWRFYLFVWRTRDPLFTLGAIVMHWFTYLYSGVGLALGVLLYLRQAVWPAPIEGRRKA
jgi:glycosyltransferase involved in cell wall biosynthesis